MKDMTKIENKVVSPAEDKQPVREQTPQKGKPDDPATKSEVKEKKDE